MRPGVGIVGGSVYIPGAAWYWKFDGVADDDRAMHEPLLAIRAVEVAATAVLVWE